MHQYGIIVFVSANVKLMSHICLHACMSVIVYRPGMYLHMYMFVFYIATVYQLFLFCFQLSVNTTTRISEISWLFAMSFLQCRTSFLVSGVLFCHASCAAMSSNCCLLCMFVLLGEPE